MHKLSVTMLAVALSIGPAAPASAEESPASARAFLEHQRIELDRLLSQPVSTERDTKVKALLEASTDFAEISRRALGQPCPLGEPRCENYWARLSKQQQAEVTNLLTLLVEKNQLRNVSRVSDYELSYKQMKTSGPDTYVRTEVRSRIHRREPPVEIDYVVRLADGRYRVVDVVTEGASVTKDYYDQLRGMLRSPAPGYRFLIGQLTQEIARRD